MPDLTITAVRITENTRQRQIDFAVNADPGQLVYVDGANNNLATLALAGGTELQARVVGIVLTPAVANGSALIATGGDVILVGAAMSPGYGQILSTTPGGIFQDSDLAGGNYISQLGRAKTAEQLFLNIEPLGVTA